MKEEIIVINAKDKTLKDKDMQTIEESKKQISSLTERSNSLEKECTRLKEEINVINAKDKTLKDKDMQTIRSTDDAAHLAEIEEHIVSIYNS